MSAFAEFCCVLLRASIYVLPLVVALILVHRRSAP